ncbi:tumor necrosis factor receptor superfamily member 4 isoform X1 [Suricata suricatta]|uniref:tumor necrosis factor receptor superfamily member 4 isoform X1 n=1 Tax=Suricata suricatta TaxID=37032 RepID=UPI0011552B48|nr:tumor necrosis factor receptor superfamily member 4 isoform X1 [Suricata suricatta]
MRMLVEAQQLRVPRSAVLLLGLALGTAARLDCVGNTYPKDGRCCSECPPGYGMESRCRANQDTKCRQCLAGFYNEAMNYEPCKPCTQCNQTVPAYLTPPQEVGVRPSRGAHPRRTRSAAVVRAPSPRMVTISELTVPLAHRGTSPQVTTRLASPGPTAPGLEGAPCGQAAKAQMLCVRTGAPQPPCLGRPRAPQPSPPPRSPRQPGLGRHRGPSHPLHSPPGVPSWPLSWAWAWASLRPWRPHWRCSCTTEPGGSPLVEIASGPPSKRSRLMPTPPWPRSEQPGPPPQARGPEGLLDLEKQWGSPQAQAATPHAHHPPGAVLGAPGLCYVCCVYSVPRVVPPP